MKTDMVAGKQSQRGICASSRNKMKASVLLAIGSVLAWTVLVPVMCRAQAEIAPDHYEMTNVEPIAQPKNGVTAKGASAQSQLADESRGTYDQSSANFAAPQNREWQDTRFHFGLLGFAIVFDGALLLVLVAAGSVEKRRLACPVLIAEGRRKPGQGLR